MILKHDLPPTLTKLCNDGAPNLNEGVNLSHHDPFLDQSKPCVCNRLVKHPLRPEDWVKRCVVVDGIYKERLFYCILDFEHLELF